ncbi:efflux RND transporter periplasmic adaptor subunit [Nitratireductor sp. ZSWI3]|uniref:efflux RND transporter periplasmic adaptor subunit n=1 Tax=Nitratireductor sp. ZSWI3 TaxID=2966359 RepID=UPI0021504147|nr:efflux RND transporter periplasmic adaptor subunit [Nitratireductor sp. ZSWI3]MCR4267675.1 efflux RND transporter periplasmic adaptor subunit [Nitratireductor sp. ZSWI3]
MIKRLLIAIVLLAVLAGGIVGFNLFRDQAIEQFFANMPAQTVTVSSVTVEKAPWKPSIEAIGTVNAIRGVDLTVETSGIVTEILFSANQQVKQDELLLRLDDRVQQADLEAQRTQAELDKVTLDRATALQERGVGSAVTLDEARAAASASAAQVDKLQAVLEQRQLRAPFAGTIGIPRIDNGQYLTPGTRVATLQDLSTMRADFTVPEQQLGLLKIGGPVRLTVNDQDVTFSGEITGIDPKVDPSSRLVSVRAEISNPEQRLTPGQFAQVKVDLPEEDDIISVPQTAVVTSLYGDHVFAVREVKGEGEAQSGGDAEKKLEARQVFVEVGRRNDGLVEIRSGLEPGDIIVTAGQNRLSNGTPVAIDNTINPSVTEGETAKAAAQ